MALINLIKAAGIRLADRLNGINDPFSAFTRSALPKYPETLAVKAQKFEEDFKAFLYRDGTIFLHRLPAPGGYPIDLGDQAIWHGIAVAMWAISNKVDPQPWRSDYVSCGLLGLQDQQPGGILHRGIGEDGTLRLDASNDSATGHLMGLYCAWKYGNDGQARKAGLLMDDWASSILSNGHALINPGGKPTTYGALVQGWMTDPLRLTLCLAIYAAAYAMTGTKMYLEAFVSLSRTYSALIPYPKVKLWWLDTTYDTHRAAIHLAILAQCSPLVESTLAAQAGLERLRTMTRKHGNVWINALCSWGGVSDPGDRDIALKVLSEFTLEDKQYNVGRDNSIDMRWHDQPWFREILWNGTWMANQPLPRWTVRSQDFYWQRNLFSLDVGSGGQPADSRHTGLDYLAAYWLSRMSGAIGANE